MIYKLVIDSDSIVRIFDGMIIPNNPTLAAWQDYQDWLNEGNTPEPADTPVILDPPNWVGFNAAFLDNENWQTIANLFSKPEIRIGVASAAGAGNIGSLTLAYKFAIADLMKQEISIDPVVLEEWQNIAIANNIPIVFGVPNG